MQQYMMKLKYLNDGVALVFRNYCENIGYIIKFYSQSCLWHFYERYKKNKIYEYLNQICVKIKINEMFKIRQKNWFNKGNISVNNQTSQKS